MGEPGQLIGVGGVQTGSGGWRGGKLTSMCGWRKGPKMGNVELGLQLGPSHSPKYERGDERGTSGDGDTRVSREIPE